MTTKLEKERQEFFIQYYTSEVKCFSHDIMVLAKQLQNFHFEDDRFAKLLDAIKRLIGQREQAIYALKKYKK